MRESMTISTKDFKVMNDFITDLNPVINCKRKIQLCMFGWTWVEYIVVVNKKLPHYISAIHCLGY